MIGIRLLWLGILLLTLGGCQRRQESQLNQVLGRMANAARPDPRATQRTPPRAAPPSQRPSALCRVPLARKSWYDMANLTADRASLKKMYRVQGYSLPHSTRTMMLATRVIQGVGQPAFQVYTLGDTGFHYSRAKPRWWPASCVKPWAVAGALMKLKEHGIRGRDTITFRDRFGTFRDKPWTLFMNLTNKRYDRLMTIAGLDTLNGPVWRKRYSLPNMVLMRSYGGMGSLRRSPVIHYTHKGKRRSIPKRYATFRSKRCSSNCTTLFELQDVIRRICMHDELPKAQRFDLYAEDAKRFKAAMLKIPNKMGRAFRRVFGRRTKGYNKSGSARGWDQIENVYIVPERGKHRYLIAGSVPWPRKDFMADPSLIVLNTLGEHTMRALTKLTTARVSIQSDTGPAMHLELGQPTQSPKAWELRVTAPGIDRVEGWNRQQKLTFRRIAAGTFVAHPQLFAGGQQLFVIRGYKAGKAIAYRAIGTDWKPGQPAPCQTKP